MYHFELKPFKSHTWNSHAQWDKELEKFLDSQSAQESFSPPCEIIDEENLYTVSLDVPGLTKNDLSIEVKDDRLFVSGERKFEKKSTADSVLRTERRYGKLSRVFTLPKNINPEGIEARFENGVLEIKLPKEQKAVAKKIQITA